MLPSSSANANLRSGNLVRKGNVPREQGEKGNEVFFFLVRLMLFHLFRDKLFEKVLNDF